LTPKPAWLVLEDGTTFAGESFGAEADVTVFDPNRSWVFEKRSSASKASNSPFYGWTLRGKAVATIVGGRKAWLENPERTGV
jgi:dihydroorotase